MKNRNILFGLIAGVSLSAAAAWADGGISFRPEIINGEDALRTDELASTTVAVLSGGGLCTGSIIANDLVVTAAHCIEFPISKMKVVFGLKVPRNGEKVPSAKVLGAVIPEDYGTVIGNDQQDIALIRIDGKLPKGYKKAKLLSSSTRLAAGNEVILAGYGITDAFTHEGSGTLRKTRVKIKSASFAKTEVLLDQTEGTGACHGDSGGPAFLTKGSQIYLWGVTNRGYPDDAPDDCAHYAVYTNINAYRDWLNEAAKRLRDEN